MKIHLLSIFPLRVSAHYSRVTFQKLDNSSLPEPYAVFASRGMVITMLEHLDLQDDIAQIMNDLDDGDSFQLAITADTTLAIHATTTSMHQ